VPGVEEPLRTGDRRAYAPLVRHQRRCAPSLARALDQLDAVAV
jgi:hypothetical protein